MDNSIDEQLAQLKLQIQMLEAAKEGMLIRDCKKKWEELNLSFIKHPEWDRYEIESDAEITEYQYTDSDELYEWPNADENGDELTTSVYYEKLNNIFKDVTRAEMILDRNNCEIVLFERNTPPTVFDNLVTQNHIDTIENCLEYNYYFRIVINTLTEKIDFLKSKLITDAISPVQP